MKKRIGFPISGKEHECRRAILPDDIAAVKNRDCLYIEKGYGEVLGIPDEEYRSWGARIAEREEVLSMEVVCDPKIGDAEYLGRLRDQTVFGWIHAVQNRDITDRIVGGRLTAYAWEDMYDGGRHTFWRNNEIAGEAAIAHAYMCHGIFPYNTKVAVLGRGNTARGAIKTLNYMGADVIVYDRRMEALFREEISAYDVIVNAVLWDPLRRDHIIRREDLGRMKRGGMIIDISCDRGGAVETSVPTTIGNPTYVVDGIRHYVVDHTPAIFFKTTTKSLSCEVAKYLDALIEGDEGCATLNNALIIRDGRIIDGRINEFQNRRPGTDGSR